MSKCKSCGASVIYTRVEATGKVAILDADPRDDGNIVLDAKGGAVYLTKQEQATMPPPRYVSHFATCPQAAIWRKGKKGS